MKITERVHGIIINCNNGCRDNWGIIYNKPLTDFMHNNGIGTNVRYWGELIAITKKQKEFTKSLTHGFGESDFEIIEYMGKRLIRCGCGDCYPSSALPIRHTDVFN